MKTMSRVLAAMLLTGAVLSGATSASADDTAHISVLHAVPGVTVDVYANGDELLSDFAAGTLTDPVSLPAGSYDLLVTAVDAGPDGDAVIEAKGVQVPAGANITVVAHLNSEGDPVLTPFVNDTSASAKGARLTVRHVAAAPEVDIRAGGAVVVESLANPKEASLDLAPGTVSADVVAAGTDTVVLGPADVTLKQDQLTVVYAWGSLEADNLALATQQVTLTADPGLPHTGAEGPAPRWPVALVGLIVVVGVAGAVILARGRRVMN